MSLDTNDLYPSHQLDKILKEAVAMAEAKRNLEDAKDALESYEDQKVALVDAVTAAKAEVSKAGGDLQEALDALRPE